MSKSLIVRPLSWINAGINLAILSLFGSIGYLVDRVNGIFLATVIFLVTSQLLRRVIARHHRSAIGHCRRQQYGLAIPEFHKSADFFCRHEWVDQYRAVKMLSAAAMCYREMALVSLGFCYAQTGEGASARQSYEQCLREYPGNAMAQAALNLMDAGRVQRLTD